MKFAALQNLPLAKIYNIYQFQWGLPQRQTRRGVFLLVVDRFTDIKNIFYRVDKFTDS